MEVGGRELVTTALITTVDYTNSSHRIFCSQLHQYGWNCYFRKAESEFSRYVS